MSTSHVGRVQTIPSIESVWPLCHVTVDVAMQGFKHFKLSTGYSKMDLEGVGVAACGDNCSCNGNSRTMRGEAVVLKELSPSVCLEFALVISHMCEEMP